MAQNNKTPDYTHENVITYLRWRGDLSFSQSPFCEVDNLVLSMTCYLNYESCVGASPKARPVALATAIDTVIHGDEDGEKQCLGFYFPQIGYDMANLMIASRRFAGTEMVAYVNEIDEEKHIQFCAMTFLLPDDTMFVAFRGTDDNIVGWKEDFMMAFMSPVPAQARAKEYLEDVAMAFPQRKIRVGGHSKGGNLSVYAAVYAPEEVQKRIIRVYSNDGPGFMPEFFQEEGYMRIEKKIMTLIPQSSIVGVLLHHSRHFHIIHSTQKAVMQHDPFSWTVCGTHFQYEKSRSTFGIRADATLDRWVEGMTMEEREICIKNLFDAISSSGAKKLSDIAADKLRSIRVMITSFARMEKKDRDMMLRIMRQLLRASRESGKLLVEPPAPSLPQKSTKEPARIEGPKSKTKKTKEKKKAPPPKKAEKPKEKPKKN